MRTSLDNFAAVVASQTIRNASSGVFNLNLASLPDSVTVPVEFRIYITNFFAAAGRADVTALNGGLVLNGSVEAVPEPASTLLLGLGLVSTWILKRRRR
ncbi:MAG TPA: PEP-CTERM sorting domain-containing protein [Caulifigura sp.]|nr:PEP-CTERM sorting domain-containing protein [Caulifigura sp.]